MVCGGCLQLLSVRCVRSVVDDCGGAATLYQPRRQKSSAKPAPHLISDVGVGGPPEIPHYTLPAMVMPVQATWLLPMLVLLVLGVNNAGC